MDKIRRFLDTIPKQTLYLFIAALFVISGYISVRIITSATPDTTETSKESVVVDSSLQLESESTTTETTGLKIGQALTDYDDYARTDEDGYAYYMVADPDISSEIFPLNEQSAENVLLFTFDDGPTEDTLRIANTLYDLNVGAIFLVNGMNLENDENRKILKEISDMGFEIGNHTQTHENLRDLDYEGQKEEIQRTNEMIEEITETEVRWFRPPFGLFNLDTIEICNELGLQLMTWSFGYDWMDEYHDGEALAEISLDNEYLRNGANILMHDLPWTADAIVDMVLGYEEQGFYIVDPFLIKRQENSTDPVDDSSESLASGL